MDCVDTMTVESIKLKAPSPAAVCEPVPCGLESVEVIPVGKVAGWFDFDRQADSVVLRPVDPMPRRATICPAALFEHDRGFVDVNTVMGRMMFSRGSTEPQTYRPFTRDPQRRLRELYFPVEASPEDDWPTSKTRWRNWQAIAKRLVAAAQMTWSGLSEQDLTELVEFVPWPEPLEGCLLYALVQATHKRGRCVVEIGSRRGRSLSILAMALRGVDSESLLISIDPHEEQACTSDHCRLALRQIGEEARLVQIQATSDRAAGVLGRGVASLVFIDGDHTYDQVIADFDHYRDILVPGGCMVFHDYGYGNHNGVPEADPDVRRAIGENVIRAKGFRPLLLAHTQFAFLKQ